MARNRTTKPTNYLNINKDGLLYKRTTADNPNAKAVVLKDGSTVHHQLFNGGTEEGYLNHIGIREADFPSGKIKQLVVVVEGETETDMISLPLFRADGHLNGYVKSIACVLPNVDFSRKLVLQPSTQKNDRGFVYQTIYFNYVNDSRTTIPTAHKYGEKGDAPPAEEITAVDGSKKMDFTKQDTFLFNVLKKEIERFQEFKGKNNTPEVYTTESNAPDNALDDEEDDLPS